MAYQEPPDRAVIPGSIVGVTAKKRMRRNAEDAAERQNNWAAHFGGNTAEQDAANKLRAARVAKLNESQQVENEYRKSQGLAPVGSTAPGAGQTREAKMLDRLRARALKAKYKRDEAQRVEDARSTEAGNKLAAEVTNDAKSGIVSRSTSGDIKYADGSTITNTGPRRVLASKYGTGSATNGPSAPAPAAPAQPATPATPAKELPPLTPATLAASAVRKIPMVNNALTKLREVVSGKTRAPASPTPPTGGVPVVAKTAPPPAAPSLVPQGATPTKSGGYMSISGTPKAVPVPATAPAPAPVYNPTEARRKVVSDQVDARMKQVKAQDVKSGAFAREDYGSVVAARIKKRRRAA